MDRFDESSLNPYAAPQEAERTVSQPSVTSLPDGRFWRMYLYAHLAVVVCAAAVTLAGSQFGQSWLPTGEVGQPLMLSFLILAMTGQLFVLAFPIILIALLMSCSRSWRYLLIALLEGLLNFAWFFIILPAVQ